MKLRIQTDYALRTLMYLGLTDRKARAEDIANCFVISKDHLVKVIQQLARLGYVRTVPGRGGGVSLAKRPEQIIVREVVESFEGRDTVLECVDSPDICPLEPGCKLRRLLMRAEDAFYGAMSETTIADLYAGRQRGGLYNLQID